jgi:hypothetical protein
MHTVYNLEMQVRDKMNRLKKTSHVGVYDSIENLEVAKSKMLDINPDNTFEVHFIDHFFESPPELV